jgi:predicted phosphodiesterase
MARDHGDGPGNRIAILSDVHGNAVALRAVLADAETAGVDLIAVAGDMIGFGPSPDDVVDLLLARGARMIRGNHEQDYVSPYSRQELPLDWRTSPYRAHYWAMDRLGSERRAFLARLPDRLLLDETTLVIHGSPRHVRDAVLAWTPDDELEAMFAGESARLVFNGHTHRPLIRDIPSRRLVNVGSAGFSLDGDKRASYALATRRGSDNWSVELRRVPFDLEAALAAYDGGMREIDPGFVGIMGRWLETGRDFYGPWIRHSRDIPEADREAALRRFLDEFPGASR